MNVKKPVLSQNAVAVAVVDAAIQTIAEPRNPTAFTPAHCAWRGEVHLREHLSSLKGAGEMISNSCTKLCMVSCLTIKVVTLSLYSNVV